MSSKHTPGPWTVRTEPGLDGLPDHTVRHFAQRIASVNWQSELPSGERGAFANARLIAAAPELLAALQAIDARVRGEWDHPALVAFGPMGIITSEDVAAIARAAIAKATGDRGKS